MSTRKSILFTFDYELFLGKKSGSVDNCMIKPTNEVLKVLEKYNLTGIFFVDSTYLVALKKVAKTSEAAKADFNAISKQIIDLLKRKHQVQLHIHPHWLDAKYHQKTNDWSLENISKYRFHNVPEQQQKVIFNESLNCLYEIIKEDFPSFRINAYRAGGWSIQPFKDFYPLFKERGIDAEFSVLGGAVKSTNAIEYDFSNIAQNAVPYRFSSNPTTAVPNGEFCQFPISSIKVKKNGFTHKTMNKLLWRLSIGQNMGDGVGVQFKSKIEPREYDLNSEMVSIELLTFSKLKLYKKFLRSENYMQFISHPKMISKHNLDTLDKFLKFASTNYELNSEWEAIIKVKNIN